MSQGNLPSRRGPGILFMLMGLVVLAIGFGVIPTNPSAVRGSSWIIALFGGTFMIAGIWVIFQRVAQQDSTHSLWINFLFALLVMLSISILCLWIGFGPGQRVFLQHNSLINHSGGLITDPTLGRIFFGGFGVLLFGLAIAIAIIQGRKLLGPK